MRKAAAILGLLVLGGCAQDEEPTPRDKLIGVWLLEVSADCIAAYVFGADDTYDLRFGCYTGPSSADLELYSGTWSTDGERISLEPKGGTCSPSDSGGGAEPARIAYELLDDGQTLRTVSPD